ncbi:MAG: hypothetical protein V1790_19135 [Planctomycetota bacterium]
MRRFNQSVVIVTLLMFMGGAGQGVGQSLSIYQIQSNTVDGDATVFHFDEVECDGGIVVAKFLGSRPRVILRDPRNPDAWAAIQVKDWTAGDLFNNVAIGDWVALANMLVEEYRGTTFLQWQTPYNPRFSIVSTGNPLPPPMRMDVEEMPAPTYDAASDGWYVANHGAEPFESMRLYVRDVTVTAKNLGKAVDNYSLQTADGYDCWAADYMNANRGPSGYHPFVRVGRHFCAVAGVFEQYTNLGEGWDYYQLVTVTTADLAICGDGDSDGDVDLADWPRFWECLTGPVCDSGGCDPPAWAVAPLELDLERCLMMDQDYDGDVDLRDAAVFCGRFGAP